MKRLNNVLFVAGAALFCLLLAFADRSWAAEARVFYLAEDSDGNIAVEEIPEQPVSNADINLFTGLLKLCYRNWDCKVQFGGMLAEQLAGKGEVVVHMRFLETGVNMSIELVTRDFKRMGGVSPDHSFVLRTMRVEFKLAPDKHAVYISCVQMEPFASCSSLKGGT